MEFPSWFARRLGGGGILISCIDVGVLFKYAKYHIPLVENPSWFVDSGGRAGGGHRAVRIWRHEAFSEGTIVVVCRLPCLGETARQLALGGCYRACFIMGYDRYGNMFWFRVCPLLVLEKNVRDVCDVRTLVWVADSNDFNSVSWLCFCPVTQTNYHGCTSRELWKFVSSVSWLLFYSATQLLITVTPCFTLLTL